MTRVDAIPGSVSSRSRSCGYRGGFGVRTVNGVDADQSVELLLFLALPRLPDDTGERVALPKSVAADHRQGHVDVVGPGQITGGPHERVVVEDVQDPCHRDEDVVLRDRRLVDPVAVAAAGPAVPVAVAATPVSPTTAVAAVTVLVIVALAHLLADRPAVPAATVDVVAALDRNTAAAAVLLVGLLGAGLALAPIVAAGIGPVVGAGLGTDVAAVVRADLRAHIGSLAVVALHVTVVRSR